MIYNTINRTNEIIDDVEIYFDNRIGIVAPGEQKEKKPKTKNPDPTDPNQPNNYKYNILKVIEKRNQEEEAIAELIKDFEDKIEGFFKYIKSDNLGRRLIAKITDDGSAFTQDEIYSDFERLYRKYVIINKNLGDFFKRETKDILNQLCDDFERSLKQTLNIMEEPGLLISLLQGGMQAISLWQNQKDRVKAKRALTEAKARSKEEINIKEGIKVQSVIPKSTLELMTNRVMQCFINYEEVLDDKKFLPKQIDNATLAIIECIYSELRRIHILNGGMPTATLKEYWELYGCDNK